MDRRSARIRERFAEINRSRRQRARLAAIDATVKRFGGAAAFAERVHEAHQHFMSKSQYPNAIGILRGVQTLAIATARPAPTPSQLSDEQLAAQRQAMLDHLVLSGELEATVRRLLRDGRLDADHVAAWVAEPVAGVTEAD